MPQKYSRIAITLHWLIAFAILFQISLGWGLEDLTRAQRFAPMQLHKSVGITILLLSVLRVLVRFWKPRPPATEGGLTGMLAKAVHVLLYGVMLGAPLTGWMIVSTSKLKVPTLLFGVVPWPRLPLPQGLHDPVEGIHGALAWVTIGLLLLHVAGAIRHHMMLKDGLMWRMTPGRSGVAMAGVVLFALSGLVVGKVILPAGGKNGEAAEAAPAAAANAAENSTGADADDDDDGDNAAAPASNAIANVAEAPAGPPPSWTVQPGGRLGFTIANGEETIRGSFGKWTGKIVLDPDHTETASLAIDIDLKSASLGDSYKDDMIGNSDFFATADHPKATFRSTQVTRTAPGRYRAKGTLNLKGVSAPQTIAFTLTGEGMKRKVAGSGTVARKTFNVGTGESGEWLALNVAIDFAFSATGK